MRQVFGAMAAGAALLSAAAATADVPPQSFDAETVGSMQILCSANEATSGGKYAVGFCYGWIEGAGQFYEQMLADERFDLKPAICAEKDLSREEVRQIFIGWAKAHTEHHDRPSLSGLIDALKEKFPCKA